MKNFTSNYSQYEQQLFADLVRSNISFMPFQTITEIISWKSPICKLTVSMLNVTPNLTLNVSPFMPMSTAWLLKFWNPSNQCFGGWMELGLNISDWNEAYKLKQRLQVHENLLNVILRHWMNPFNKKKSNVPKQQTTGFLILNKFPRWMGKQRTFFLKLYWKQLRVNLYIFSAACYLSFSPRREKYNGEQQIFSRSRHGQKQCFVYNTLFGCTCLSCSWAKILL